MKTDDRMQVQPKFYTVPSKVQYNQPYYLVYESDNFLQENEYILYRINTSGNSTFLSAMNGSTLFSSLSFEEKGKEKEKENDVIKMTTDVAGNMYALSKKAHCVYKYDTISKKFEPFIRSKTLFHPTGMAFDNDNYLYVSNMMKETMSPRISVFDGKGYFLYDIFSELLSCPGDLKRDKKGNLYVLNEKVLHLPANPKSVDYNPNSKFNGFFLMLHILPNNNTLSGTVNIFTYETLNQPISLAFDSYNNGYICNKGNRTTSKLDMVTGEANLLDSKDAFMHIIFDKKDRMYAILDTDDKKIYRDNNGFLELYCTNPLSVTSFLFDKNDNLFVADPIGEINKLACNRAIFHIKNNTLLPGNHPLIIYDDKNRKTVVPPFSITTSSSSPSPSYPSQSYSSIPPSYSRKRFNISNVTKRVFGYGNIIANKRNHTRRH